MNSHDQEAEGIIREHDKIHAGEISRVERQHAFWGPLIFAIAESEQARGRPSKVDDNDEKARQSVDAKMRAEPRQTERQCHGRARPSEQTYDSDDTKHQHDDQTCGVDHIACARRCRQSDRDWRKGQQRCHAIKRVDRHQRLRIARVSIATPRAVI
jgi:hypothetical protein